MSCVYVAPGNGGMGTLGAREESDHAPLVSVDLELSGPDYTQLIDLCKARDILRWAKSRDSYRRIASESYRCDSNR